MKQREGGRHIAEPGQIDTTHGPILYLENVTAYHVKAVRAHVLEAGVAPRGRKQTSRMFAYPRIYTEAGFAGWRQVWRKQVFVCLAAAVHTRGPPTNPVIVQSRQTKLQSQVLYIGHMRILLGAHSLLLGAKTRGAATSANLTMAKFYSSTLAVDCTMPERVTAEQFHSQYREYVWWLEVLAANPEKRKLSYTGKLIPSPDDENHHRLH